LLPDQAAGGLPRRRLIAAAGAVALLGRLGRAQSAPAEAADALADFLTLGAPVRHARVLLELPLLIENGNSVPMKVTVESPMTAQDHVRVIHLISEKNPVRHMASFHLGPRAGRAEIQSRIRLAGSQRVVALAQMSDGTFWADVRSTLVTLSACIDESGT
jgi:sulfur-oxidizing protein SoxY